MSFSNISFILHKPQLSENIGACARALKNFNFKKLVIINPKPVFPNSSILINQVSLTVRTPREVPLGRLKFKIYFL